MSYDYFGAPVPAAGASPVPPASGPDPSMPPPGAHPGWRPPAPPEPEGPSGRAAPGAGLTLPLGAVLLGLAGVLLVVGALLPWVQLSVFSLTGTSSEIGTGRSTLAVGVVALVGAAAALRGGSSGRDGALLLAGLFAGVRVLLEREDVLDIAREVEAIAGRAPSRSLPQDFLDEVLPQVGLGLWVSLLGAVVLVTGAVVGLLRAR